MRTPFSWDCRHFSSERRVPIVVNLGGVVKTLRRSNSLSGSVFSTAGSFGLFAIETVGRQRPQLRPPPPPWLSFTGIAGRGEAAVAASSPPDKREAERVTLLRGRHHRAGGLP